MCKQLLLFAQTTCSFWTQTTLWRTMCVNSVGASGTPRTREAYPPGVGCIRWFGPAGRQPASALTCFAVLSPTSNKRWQESKRKTWVAALLTETVRRCERIGSRLCSLSAKRWVYFSKAEALGGMITKVIKRVIAKSQQESGNATYSISLSYGIYRKNTDKQRA